MKKIVIAIDGFSACGKSTTAKAVAASLNYGYIDTGAMYRAVTLYFRDNYINLTNPKSVAKALSNIEVSFHYNEKTNQNETYLNGLNVEGKIRHMEISNQVSEVSAIAEVRKAMVAEQRKMGRKRGVVMDGRDIGTVVFPDADLKIFMQASFQVRAERRQQEILAKGELVGFDEVMENLKKRDNLDTTRTESPLRKADEAFVIDTTYLTFEEQVEDILRLATSQMIESHRALNEI